jgi:putative CocE/NonD family hydrolase
MRGKFRSEGLFEHHRRYIRNKASPLDTDEASDAYDTIEWLLEHIPGHNGRVGQWGISYAGWLAVMGMIEPHPALRASSPQASPADQYIGDDYYHNGAFRLMYAFDWTWQCAQMREGPTEREIGEYEYGTPDGYRFFLDLGPISNVNDRCFYRRIPMWNELIEHWTYDEYWQAKNVLKDLKDVTHPVLNVVGWFDAEDYYGPLGIYATIEGNNPSNQSTLVIGPWSHGGWVYRPGDSLGNVRFGSDTAVYYREKVELPFFNRYLKDKGTLDLPEALVFETGANQWRSYDSWPPRDARIRNLYLHPEQTLSFGPPSGSSPEPFDSFVSDPGKPVPYTAEMRTLQGHLWIVEDQRFVYSRPDVLVYESEVLEEEVRIAGPIVAELYVSTTGTDADWVVKLIDVYPDDASDNQADPDDVPMGGFQMLLAADVIRSKFRNSLTHPQPLVRGRVTRIEFSLLDKHHTFKEGHRIMVQIQSSWFPLIDRNPQVFLPIPEAKEEDFQIATHRVYHSPQHPSSIKIPVLE